MTDVAVSLSERELKITLNGVPHFRIDRREIIGVQSWVVNRGRDTHCYAIEFATRSNPMKLEYDRYETWATILQQMDSLPILNEFAVQDP